MGFWGFGVLGFWGNDEIAKLTATMVSTQTRGGLAVLRRRNWAWRPMPASELKTFPMGPQRPVADEARWRTNRRCSGMHNECGSHERRAVAAGGEDLRALQCGDGEEGAEFHLQLVCAFVEAAARERGVSRRDLCSTRDGESARVCVWAQSGHGSNGIGGIEHECDGANGAYSGDARWLAEFQEGVDG